MAVGELLEKVQSKNGVTGGIPRKLDLTTYKWKNFEERIEELWVIRRRNRRHLPDEDLFWECFWFEATHGRPLCACGWYDCEYNDIYDYSSCDSDSE